MLSPVRLLVSWLLVFWFAFSLCFLCSSFLLSFITTPKPYLPRAFCPNPHRPRHECATASRLFRTCGRPDDMANCGKAEAMQRREALASSAVWKPCSG